METVPKEVTSCSTAALQMPVGLFGENHQPSDRPRQPPLSVDHTNEIIKTIIIII